MKFLIGYKKAMTQHYREDGSIVPVTIVEVNPVVVTQVKTKEKEGYDAVQLGIGQRARVGKAQAGHLSTILATGRKPFHQLQEVRLSEPMDVKHGDTFGVNLFEAGDRVSVTGVSKGKGFQGVVKRHGFHGSDEGHGNKDQTRMPGSIGAQEPQRVFKGTRMAGRMGGDQVTVKNLEIIAVNANENQLFVKGALPGARNGLVFLQAEGEQQALANLFESSQEASTEPKEEPVAKQEEASKNEEDVETTNEQQSEGQAISNNEESSTEQA